MGYGFARRPNSDDARHSERHYKSYRLSDEDPRTPGCGRGPRSTVEIVRWFERHLNAAETAHAERTR